MNTAYLIAMIALVSAAVPFYFGSRMRDSYGTTGPGIVLIVVGCGLLLSAFIFTCFGLDIQYVLNAGR
jgi:hypothetical protein